MLGSKSFRDKIKVYGKQIDVLLETDNMKFNKTRVVSVEQNIYGEMFTSVMRLLTLEVDKGLDISSDDLLTVKDVHEMTVENLNRTRVKYLAGVAEDSNKLSDVTELNVKLGVKLEDDENYEYVDLGKFVVYDFKNCVDTNSYKLTLYDHLIDTHVKYDDEPLNLDYASGKVTVGNLLQAICNKFGFTCKTTNFTNSSKKITEDKYAGLDVTYRDILDEIAAVAGGFIKIFNKDLYVAYPTETGEVFNEDDLKSLNVGKRVGPFNTVVLARSPQEDNIYYPTNIADENRVSIRIENNQIMDKNREDFIVDLYNRVNGLEYYAFEYECFGFGYFEFGDIVTLVDLNGKEYKTILMNIVDSINTGITGKAYTEETEFAETKYEYAASIEKRVRNTEIICDKQNNEIRLLVEEQSVNEEKFTQLELDIDGITSNVSQQITTALGDYYTKTQTESQIEQTADSITLTVSETYATKDSLGNYSTTSQVQSMIKQTASTIEMSVSNNSTTAGITITLKDGNGNTLNSQTGTINMTGLVKFSDLSTSGNTIINGANITTGTISSERLDTSTINATTGTIGNINITSSGLYYSGTAANDGFGLWKSNYHASDNSYIIFHAGGNRYNIGSALFKILQNGKMIATTGKIGNFEIKDGSLYVKRSDGIETEVSENGFQIWDTATIAGGTVKYNHVNINSEGIVADKVQITDYGYVMHGMDIAHRYRVHWTGTKLNFYVDNSLVASL